MRPSIDGAVAVAVDDAVGTEVGRCCAATFRADDAGAEAVQPVSNTPRTPSTPSSAPAGRGVDRSGAIIEGLSGRGAPSGG